MYSLYFNLKYDLIVCFPPTNPKQNYHIQASMELLMINTKDNGEKELHKVACG